MTAPRVFHLIKSLGRGGAETLLSQSLSSPARRYECSYGYFLPWKDALVPELEAAGAKVLCFGAKSSAGMMARLPAVVRHLRRERPDVVHCHLPLAGVVGRLAGRLAGIPVVYSEHNMLERYHGLTRRASLATWSMQSRVIAVSEEVAKSIREHTGSQVPIHRVRNGVDTRRFNPAEQGAGPDKLRAELGIPDGTLVVGTCAVFRTQKRLDRWLEVARRLAADSPDLAFVIVGDGPLADELRAKAVALGLVDQVHFVGLKDDVRPYLAMMDLYMMSSVFEGLPVALLEAMAMGIPTVTTDVGGIPEAVVQGSTGFLVGAGENHELAAAAARLLGSPELRDKMGTLARQRVEAEFSVDRMTGEIEGIYDQVVGG